MAKISRKYDTLMKFLRETVANEKLSIRTRMAAAERLDNIYARHEAAAEKEIRQARAKVKKDEPDEAETVEPETPQQMADALERQQINELLGRVDRA